MYSYTVKFQDINYLRQSDVNHLCGRYAGQDMEKGRLLFSYVLCLNEGDHLNAGSKETYFKDLTHKQ